MAVRERTYPWKRYWVPTGTTIRTGLDGFIADPGSTLGQRLSRGAVRLDELSDPPLVALEGDAGLGKTRAVGDAVTAAHDNGGSVVCLDAGDFESADSLRAQLLEQLSRLSKSKDRPAFAFIDGIDEVAFGGRLASLSAIVSPEIRLRLICRTAAWPARLRERLQEAGAHFYELVPLTRPDIARAAELDGVNTDAFLTTVRQRNVEILASRPLTLLELLDDFREQGTLPRSRTQLFMQACRRHCDEHNASHRDLDARRADRCTVNLRLTIMARLAAFSVLCDSPTLDDGPVGSSARRLFLTDLAGGTEVVDGSASTTTENMVRDACRACGLISAASSGGLTFGHRSFVEFLTAYYLHSRNVPLDQIRDVLCHPDQPSRLASQLRGVASALASMNANFASWLIGRDSEAALAADFADFSPCERAQLVDALLETGERVARVSIWSSWHVLPSLVHPGLHEQLRQILTNDAAPVGARDLAIDIAVACEQTELCSLLADLAISIHEPSTIRSAAAHALLQLPAERGVTERMLSLLDRSEADPDENLRGCALQLLWPDRVPNDPFSYVSRPLRRHYVGSYSRFLSEKVPERLRPQDLKSALQWLKRQQIVPHQDTDLERVRDAILRCAWQNASTPELVRHFVPILRRALQAYDTVVPPRDDDSPGRRAPDLSAIPIDVRRAVLLEVCAPVEGNSTCRQVSAIDVLHCQPPLLLAADFPWVLELVADEANASRAKIWAEAADRLLWFNLNADTADALVVKALMSSQVRTLLGNYLEPVEILSERADALRAERKKALEFATPRPPRARPQVPLEQVLAEAESRGSVLWPNVAYAIALAVSEGAIWSARKVLTYVGDQEERLRSRIISVAESYLRENDDKSAEWISLNTFPYVAFAGWVALRVLATYDSGTFERLEPRLYARWAAAILFARDYDEQDGKRGDPVLPAGYAAAPDAFLSALRLRALGENVYHKTIYVVREADSIWDERIEHLALDLLRDAKVSDAAAAELTDSLLRHGSAEGLAVASELIKKGSAEPTFRMKGVAVGAVLLQWQPEIAWALLVDIKTRLPEYTRELFKRFASRHHRDGASVIASKVDPARTADIYLWLTEEFPTEGDPEFEDAHAITDREAVGDLRDGLLRALASSGAMGSVEALERVASAHPQRDLHHLVLEAEERVLSGTWHPVTMADLRTLLANVHQRRLESGEQLLDLVVRALTVVQSRLHGVSPTAQFLWDTAGLPTPKEEAALSDLLKHELDRELVLRPKSNDPFGKMEIG